MLQSTSDRWCSQFISETLNSYIKIDEFLWMKFLLNGVLYDEPFSDFTSYTGFFFKKKDNRKTIVSTINLLGSQLSRHFL